MTFIDVMALREPRRVAPRRRRQIDNKNAATWRSKIIIKPCSRDKYIYIHTGAHTHGAAPQFMIVNRRGARPVFLRVPPGRNATESDRNKIMEKKRIQNRVRRFGDNGDNVGGTSPFVVIEAAA